jgi:hypothetical protein
MILLAAAPAAADSILYQGTFSQDNQVQEFLFTIASPSTVTLETYGFAGGTVGSTTVPGGGFDPTLVLFLPPTNDTFFSTPCGGAAVPDSNGFCEDAYLQKALLPGTYYVALMVNDNGPNGGPTDPFLQDLFPGFTCQEAGGLPGSFCDIASGYGEPRSGQWALTIDGVDSSVETPEPGAISLAGIGMALAAFLARRREVRNRRIA